MYSAGIFVEGLRTIVQNLTHNSRYPSWELDISSVALLLRQLLQTVV